MGKIACGLTVPSQWRQHNPRKNEGLFVDVDTSSAGFIKTPVYVTSLYGRRGHWMTTGGSSVCDPTPKNFRVYIRYADGSPLARTVAQREGWYIEWIGMEE